MHLHIVFVLLYSICQFVSDTSFFSFWVCGKIRMSFNCNNSFTYVLHVIILDFTKKRVREQERKRKVTPMASHRYHLKRRIKQEYLAVAHLLLHTSNLLFTLTVYKYHSTMMFNYHSTSMTVQVSPLLFIYHSTSITTAVPQYKYHHCCSSTTV